MTRTVLIPSASFTQPGLPVFRPFADRILALPNLTSWFNGAPATIVRGTDDRLVTWRDRSPAKTIFAKSALADAASPLVVPKAYNGRGALRFVKSRGDAITWSGQRGIGNARLTSVMIATLTPTTTTPQHLLSDITPNGGWNALYVKKETSGTVALYLSTGSGGAVGKVMDITSAIGRPMLIMTVIDAFYGSLEMRINGRAVSITAASPVLTASDVNIGTSGYPDVLADIGVDMDLFEVITMQNDIFAAGLEHHHAMILDYAKAAYGII